MDVTQAWMFGVVAMMLVFASFAAIGYVVRHARKDQNDRKSFRESIDG